MSNLSLNIGLNALLTSQAGLDTVGHNIANANTPGYTRQSLVLQAGRPMQLRGLQMGSGVEATTVKRTVDEFINRRLFGQTSVMKHIEARLTSLADTESLLGEPGGVGIGGMLDEMFLKLSELSTSPSDPVARNGAVRSVDALAGQISGVGTELARMDAGVIDRLQVAADQVNSIGRGIADLNEQIVAVEARGDSANDLRDQRDMFVRQLSEQVDVTVLESPRGSTRVFLDGQMLVGDAHSNELLVNRDSDGGIELSLAGGTQPITAHSGAIGGLISFAESTLPDLRENLDRIARGLILEVNRRHSEGIPASGGFEQLTSDFAITDSDDDGQVLDERLRSLGGPFEVRDGELFVHVRREATGAVETHRLAIDPRRMTVGDLVQDLSSIDQLVAGVDSAGTFQIQAAAGFTFDFSHRLDTDGNSQGSFGGAQASLGTSAGAPFALAAGDTLTLDAGSGPFDVTFDPADFANLGFATAQEVAAAINADADTGANGLRAVVSGDQVFLQTLSEGAAASFDVVGGGAALALGWTPGTTVSGQDRAVEVRLAGTYTGQANQRLTFRANMDGEVGATAGLEIEVFDASGTRVASLDVGADYLPGAELALPDGMSISFSSGAISATDGDSFTRDLLADSDTSDVLVALGLNGLLTGTDAESIGVAQRVLDDPRLLASSASGASGDNGALLELLELQQLELAGLEESIGGFYAGLVGDVGLQVQSADRALEIEGQLMTSLEARRDQVSGVSLDEELVNLIQFEQAFGAAARFIQVVGTLQDEVLNLI